MEKLKCSSCGAVLEVEGDKEYARCPYCGSKYKLNEDVNINIKMDDNTKEVINGHFGTIKKAQKFAFIPIIIIIIVFISIAFIGIKVANRSDKEWDVTSFNSTFSNDAGTKSAFFLKSTLDEIIESNKTHDRKVILVFDGKETTNEKEIIEIKHSLSGDYEVSIDYDGDGYVNKVIVEKILEK